MNQWTVSRKLVSITAAIVLLTAIVGGTAVYGITTLAGCIRELGVHWVRATYLSGDVNVVSSHMQDLSRDILLRYYWKEPDQANAYHELFLKDAQRMHAEAAELLSLIHNPTARELCQHDIIDQIDPIVATNEQVYQLLQRGDMNSAVDLFKAKVVPATTAFSDKSDELAQMEGKLGMAFAQQQQSVPGPLETVSIMSVVAALACGGIAFFLVRALSGQLQTEVHELRDGSEQIASAAAQVSSASQSLAQGASQQLASLEETSAAAEQVSSMAQRNVQCSTTVAALMRKTQPHIQSTNQELRELVCAMDQLNASSEKISSIIETIDGIAFQTNILALNAAVEAARAGDAGMGFAVVADEVRSLAMRAAQAATDTAALIRDSIARSTDGKQRVAHMAISLQVVTQSLGEVSQATEQVLMSSEEQGRGVSQISGSLAQIERVTQSAAASSQQCAAAAQQLDGQTDSVRQIVTRLGRMVEGDAQLTLSRMGHPTPRESSRARLHHA